MAVNFIDCIAKEQKRDTSHPIVSSVSVKLSCRFGTLSSPNEGAILETNNSWDFSELIEDFSNCPNNWYLFACISLTN